VRTSAERPSREESLAEIAAGPVGGPGVGWWGILGGASRGAGDKDALSLDEKD
jgi:hypothetical protein